MIWAVLLLCVGLVVPDSGVAQEGYRATDDGLPGVALEVETLLTLTGAPAMVRLVGELEAPLAEAELVVSVRGPGDPFAAAGELPEVGAFRQSLGDVAGPVTVDVRIDPLWLDQPGAYRVRVGLVSGGVEQAVFQTWLGRVAADAPIVDVAVVVPMAIGIWQDADGLFFGGLLDEAVAPASSGEGLSELARLVDVAPGFRFTLAMEPVLLSQLDDMASGYTARTASGQVEERGPETATAVGAGLLLDSLQSVALVDGVQCLPMPYATPPLAALAAQGWDDGLAQVRLGKVELLRLVAPPETPRGAYPPGLDLGTASIAAFSQASIDYVLVRETVLADLAESPSGTLQPVRVSDTANNRLTVLPVPEDLAAAFSGDADVGLLCAAVAQRAADGSARSIVIAPLNEYDVPSPSLIALFAQEILESGAFRSVTVDELVERQPPDRRPILLSRYGGYAEGLISRTLAEEITAVHGMVSDYLAAADATAPQAAAVAVKLFRAESRHWVRSDLPPELAGEGIRYARAARMAAATELAQVTIADLKLARGSDGGTELRVSVDNASAYSWDLLLETGPGGGAAQAVVMNVTVVPGRNVFSILVQETTAEPGMSTGSSTGDHSVRLLAGSTEVATASVSVARGWMAGNAWWLVLGGAILGVAVAVGGVLLYRWRRAKAAVRRDRRRVTGRR